MEFDALTEKIIGCAFHVYNHMGFGLLESVYEKCMLIELERNGLHAESQIPIKAHYEGIVVGDFIADIVVEDTVIVELKSVRSRSQIHEAQLVNYLVIAGIPMGLLLDFGEKRIQIRRRVRVLHESCSSCYPVRVLLLDRITG